MAPIRCAPPYGGALPEQFLRQALVVGRHPCVHRAVAAALILEPDHIPLEFPIIPNPNSLAIAGIFQN
jgi:hypothetical protein